MTPTPPTAPALPTARMRGVSAVARRSVFWIGAAVIAIVVVIASALLTRSISNSETALDGDSAAPQGARAVLEVLRAQGVDVVVASTADEALSALTPTSTLAVFDPNDYLTGDKLTELAASASQTVLVQPGFVALQALAPGVNAAGESDETSLTTTPEESCRQAAAQRAEEVSGGATYTTDQSGSGCFETNQDSFALITLDDAPVTVVGPTAIFTNEKIVQFGNAALALSVLGSESSLVWYLPSLDDVEASGPPSLAELTPPWLVPSIAVLALATLAAMLWRGRRFGPLVAEDLPVTVKSGETMQGRARLYQRSGSKLRAADSLRIGATGRMSTALGLPRTSSVYEVADAAAALISRPVADVRGILVDQVPVSEGDLIALADAVRELESSVISRTRPQST